MKKNKSIPVIDLFAGPGGLAEGFSSVEHNSIRAFNIGLSVEKDSAAHKTLLLRSFLRQFPLNQIPKEYYSAIEVDSIDEREKSLKLLFEKYHDEFHHASLEACLHELGKDDDDALDKKITSVIDGNKNWVLIGGPPCQAYSMAGRSRVGGISNDDHRVYLYREYLRVIAKHKPAVFVMENVKGLLSAKVNGKSVFDMILNDLENPNKVFPEFAVSNYKVYSLVSEHVSDSKDYLIKSEKYGIPQKRHRVILIGVRSDINRTPSILNPQEELITVDDAIGDLPKIRSALNRKFKTYENVAYEGGIKKMRRYTSIKDSNENWERICRKHVKEIQGLNGFEQLQKPRISCPVAGIGGEFIEVTNPIRNNSPLRKWYTDKNLNGFVNHVSRSHLIEDLKRYFFASWYGEENDKSPNLSTFRSHSEELLPDHNSVNSGKFADRFRVQIKNHPATTITSHISKDGHYFIHFDKSQNRSLTVREAARIQTFPDNYLFRGSRTQQFHQVGNAVPPFLAYQIGKIVKQILIGHV